MDMRSFAGEMDPAILPGSKQSEIIQQISQQESSSKQGTSTASARNTSESLMKVSLNGAESPALLFVLETPEKKLFFLEEDLEELGVRHYAGAPLVFNGKHYFSVDDIVGASIVRHIEDQSAAITVDPSTLSGTKTALTRDRPALSKTATGAYMNYNVTSTFSGTQREWSGIFNGTVLTNNGYATMDVAGNGLLSGVQQNDVNKRIVRLDTAWHVDSPDNLTSWTFGDAFQRTGQLGSSVRFAGFSYGTNFSLQPNLITMATQSATGVATLPSIVDVYIDQQKVATREVRPGPFSIDQIPVVSGNGQLSVVVRDTTGREQIISRPFYASPTLMAPGLSDFGFSSGFARRNFGVRSNDYGPITNSIFYRKGLTSSLTTEIRAYNVGSDVMGGASFVLPTPAFKSGGEASGIMTASLGVTRNNANAETSAAQKGFEGGLSFSRATSTISKGELSFTTSARMASRGFLLPGSTSTSDALSKEMTVLISKSIGVGSVNFSAIRRSYWNSPALSFYTGSYSRQIFLGGSLVMSLSKAVLDTKKTTQASLSVSFPIGRDTHRTRVRFDAEQTAQGNTIFTAAATQDPPLSNGTAYNVEARSDGQALGSLLLRQSAANVLMEAARTNRGDTGAQLTVSGAIGNVGGHAFASSPITSSFAVVKVNDIPGVKIYRENNFIGETDEQGSVIVSGLTPFQKNKIDIDPLDLDMNTQIGSTQIIVVPSSRGAVIAGLPVFHARPATVNIVDENGLALPPGTFSEANGAILTVGKNGVAYIEDTEKTVGQKIIITLREKSCEIMLPAVPSAKFPPFLGSITCKAIKKED
jgi:outer membrane usher protein